MAPLFSAALPTSSAAAAREERRRLPAQRGPRGGALAAEARAIRAPGSPARRRCEGEGPNDGGGSCYNDDAKGGMTAAAAEVVKIADFGVARLGNQEGQMTAETGTYRWMAPEIINHKPYDHRADVFSFAIVLWELATSKVPYDNMTPLQAALGVRQGYRLEIPPSVDPRLSELIGQCWDEDPDVRPIFAEIIVQLEDILQHVEWQAPKGGPRRSRAKTRKKTQPQ